MLLDEAIRVAAVHPHGCGEHFNVIYWSARTDGSSPRVWGTRRISILSVREERFIPTGVGNTLFVRFVLVLASVHPHGCG